MSRGTETAALDERLHLHLIRPTGAAHIRIYLVWGVWKWWTGIEGETAKDCIRQLQQRLAPTPEAFAAADETNGTTYP